MAHGEDIALVGKAAPFDPIHLRITWDQIPELVMQHKGPRQKVVYFERDVLPKHATAVRTRNARGPHDT
ncbi:hypothetical protein TBR22_A52000 [Luteitalea sp. TBR-22]|nr:hypothetical protein TBR22_A52000 [Luteitalea sp. TBR-22]